MAFLKWPDKDPDDVLDYVIDWTARMAEGDAISASTWTVPAGLTKQSDSHDDATTTVWLLSGTIGVKYTLTNRVVTTDGRTMDQSVTLKIKTK